jgi:hypothetical protein
MKSDQPQTQERSPRRLHGVVICGACIGIVGIMAQAIGAGFWPHGIMQALGGYFAGIGWGMMIGALSVGKSR